MLQRRVPAATIRVRVLLHRLCAVPLAFALLSVVSFPAGGGPSGGRALFESVGTIREAHGRIHTAALLPGGDIAYYWERTRPPTEGEKARRAEWFDKQWEEFRRRAEQEGLPKIEQKSEELARKLEEEISKQPPIIQSMQPFFSAAVRGIPMLMRLALNLALPLARQHFINQPVVEEAGLRVWGRDHRGSDLLRVDVAKLYGVEEWMRMPIDALNLRTSPDGRYMALETAEEAFTLFELKGGALVHVAQIQGRSPLGWSRNGRLLYVARREVGKGTTISLYAMEGLREEGRCGPFQDIRAVAISDEGQLAVGGGNFLKICRRDGSSLEPDRRTLGIIGRLIYGLEFPRDGLRLYVASERGFAVVDPRTFAILDQYIRSTSDDFRFEKLAGVSLDGRYAAALYGRERPGGWATLFFWDVRDRRVVQRIGAEPGPMLASISSGFRFIYPPALFTEDWRYLLVIRQNGSLELFRRTQ